MSSFSWTVGIYGSEAGDNGPVLRVRNRVIMSIHEFYQERGFVQMDAPILTGNAVEGTSTLF